MLTTRVIEPCQNSIDGWICSVRVAQDIHFLKVVSSDVHCRSPVLNPDQIFRPVGHRDNDTHGLFAVSPPLDIAVSPWKVTDHFAICELVRSVPHGNVVGKGEGLAFSAYCCDFIDQVILVGARAFLADQVSGQRSQLLWGVLLHLFDQLVQVLRPLVDGILKTFF